MKARFLILLLPALAASAAGAESLDPKAFVQVTFRDLPPTAYAQDGDALKIAVDRSASFLLKAYDKPLTVRSVRFQWRTDGKLAKAGDDTTLKIGLLLAGEAPLVPFFSPFWVKMIRSTLKLPTDRALFLVPGSDKPAGSRWPSLQSDKLEMLSVASRPVPGAAPWLESDAAFKDPLSVVGLWIMADGDDTGSRFTTWLRGLSLN